LNTSEDSQTKNNTQKIISTGNLLLIKTNEKFELMLMRCAKAYSSSYSQTVNLSPAFSSQFILEFCAAAEDHKK